MPLLKQDGTSRCDSKMVCGGRLEEMFFLISHKIEIIVSGTGL